MKARPVADIFCHILVAGEAKAGLGFALEDFVTIVAVVFELCMGRRELTRHHQFIERPSCRCGTQ